MSLVEALEKLVEVFEDRGISMRPHLRPGLTRAQVQATLSSLGLTPPEELYQLYEWHDGVDLANAPKRLFAEQQFLPLSEAIQEHVYLLKYNSEVTTSINLSQCFPIAFFEGDYDTIYCDSNLVEGLQHPVINIYDAITVRYENVARMAQTVAEWYVSGIYDDPPLVEDVNGTLRRAIRERLNPRIPKRTTSL